MGKRITRIILYILCAVAVFDGAFLIYRIFSPEIQYRIVKPDEKAVIETIENTAEFDENRPVIHSSGVDMEIGADESYLDYGGGVQRSMTTTS